MVEPQNTYDTVHTAITDVVSRPQDNVVLVYGNSSKDTYNAMAFQVIRAVRRIERVEQVTTLADDGTLEFGYLGENGHSRTTSTPGDDVFAIESDRGSTLVEYGFAVPQDGVYVGLQTGDGDTVNGLTENDERDRGLGADDLPQRGGVLSDLTRVDTPSATLEEPIPTTALSERQDQGVFRIDSEQNGDNPFRFAFNNQSGGQVDVDVTGMGVTYDVRPIEDTDVVKDMLAGNGYNRRVIQYGAFGNTNPNIPREWFNYRASVGPGELTAGVSG
jgi:hypothetical protein